MNNEKNGQQEMPWFKSNLKKFINFVTKDAKIKQYSKRKVVVLATQKKTSPQELVLYIILSIY